MLTDSFFQGQTPEPGQGPRPAARARWQQIGKPRLVITEISLEVVVVVLVVVVV
jgi:hypothetical protein